MAKHRYVRSSVADSILKGYQSAILSCYRRAYREAWTLEKLLDHRKECVEKPIRAMYDDQIGEENPGKPKRQLPHFAQGEMSAYSRLLFAQWQAKHIWTHVWLADGRRLISGHPDITDHGPSGIYIDISYHCYAFELDGKVVWLPVGENDRAQEIASGRLTDNQIKRCTSVIPDGIQLFSHMKPNGTVILMKPVPISH